MPVDMKQANAYIQEIMQKFDKNKDGLTEVERRLVLKSRDSQGKADRLAQDLEQLRSQIKQAEARARSMELQLADAQGKTNAHLEFLVSMKFEKESELPQSPAIPTPRPPKMTPPSSLSSMKKRAAALKKGMPQLSASSPSA